MPHIKELNEQRSALYSDKTVSDAEVAYLKQDSTDSEACEDATDFSACYYPRCAANNDNIWPVFKSSVEAYDKVAREQFAERYRYGTGVAANLANPVLHERVMQEMRASVVSGPEFDTLRTKTTQMVGFFQINDCNGGVAPSSDQGKTDEGDSPDAPKCAQFLNNFTINVSLGPFEISSNCESISVSTSTEGWIGVFVSGSYDAVNGSGTVAVGVTGSLKVPFTEIGVSAQMGFYGSADKNGPSDFGMKVETAGTFGTGLGHTITVGGPGYTLSFASQTLTFQNTDLE